jgi:hypothetical protein
MQTAPPRGQLLGIRADHADRLERLVALLWVRLSREIEEMIPVHARAELARVAVNTGSHGPIC